MNGYDWGDNEGDIDWRPADIIDITEQERNAALNEVCMIAIRIVLPDPAQVQLYTDLMVQVPGLSMTCMDMPSVEGAELVNVAWGKYLIVRAIVVSKWGMTGKIPYASSRIVQIRTILTNFL